MTPGIRVLGWGRSLGKRRVSNDDLSRFMETNDDWIRSRTGIAQRYYVAEETTLDLALAAAAEALTKADIEPKQVEVAIVASFSYDKRMPSMATQLQGALGLSPNLIAFDLNGACTGFVQAVETARSLLAQRPGAKALVIGAETISHWIDWTDRSTAVLFGDGAGAVVMETAETPYVAQFGCLSDAESLTVAPNKDGESFVRMEGATIFRFALRSVAPLLINLCRAREIAPDQLDAIVLHQANTRIIEKVADKLALPQERFYQNLENTGNTSAASVPLALAELADSGRLQKGMTVAMAGFGAGLTWGGMVYEW